MKKNLFFCMALLMPLTSYAWANDIQTFALRNGLKLLVKEDHRAPVVFSSIWYNVGASNESLGITGISHALEHMMFRGTPRWGSGQLSRIIADNGGQENAATWSDFTYYYYELPAEKLAISFELEADRMQHLCLDEKDFKKEMQVVMEERRLSVDDDPEQKTLERFNAMAHVASPYHHGIIGWMHDLQNMQVNDLKQWYQNWYSPNNAMLLVVGDVKPQAVYALAQRYFGSLPPRALPVVKPQKEIEPLGKRELLVAIPAKLPLLLLGYNVPSLVTAESTKEAYTLTVLAAILNGSDSARLPQKLVRMKQMASSTQANYTLYSRFDSLFTLSAVPTQKVSIEQLEAALLAEIKNLQIKPVPSKELDRVKKGLIANKIFEKDSISAQAIEIGRLVSIGQPVQEVEAYAKRIQAVTSHQIQNVAKKYLVEKRLTVAKLNPLPME